MPGNGSSARQQAPPIPGIQLPRAGEDSFAELKEVRFGKRSVISPNVESFGGEI